MNRLFTISLFILMILSRPCSAAGVMAQVIPSADKTMDVVFYSDEKEVARWQYDKDGNIAEKSGNVPNGRVDTYSEGRLMSQVYFKNGQLSGTSRDYHANGKLRTVAKYKDDQLNGKLVVYYESGEKHYVTYYRKGIPYGVMNVYWQNGKPKTRGTFEDGKIIMVERFDQAGKMYNKNILPEGKTLSSMEMP